MAPPVDKYMNCVPTSCRKYKSLFINMGDFKQSTTTFIDLTSREC